ncbi:MAG: hypothetical protein R3E79_04420 [Caldilineaceae bacterium]
MKRECKARQVQQIRTHGQSAKQRLLVTLGLSVMLLFSSCTNLTIRTADGGTPTYIVRLSFASPGERDRLAAELDVWEVNQREQFLIARVRPDQYLALATVGWRMELDCAKMEQYTDALALDVAAYTVLCGSEP